MFSFQYKTAVDANGTFVDLMLNALCQVERKLAFVSLTMLEVHLRFHALVPLLNAQLQLVDPTLNVFSLEVLQNVFAWMVSRKGRTLSMAALNARTLVNLIHAVTQQFAIQREIHLAIVPLEHTETLILTAPALEFNFVDQVHVVQ